MRRVRWDEVEDLVSGKPYVGGLRLEDLSNFTYPLVHLFVSKDRLVLRPRFGLARFWRPWVVDRADVEYIGARFAGSIVMESVWTGTTEPVWIGAGAKTALIFWTWRSLEIIDRLRDLGYPCKPNTGPGSVH
jgi:hypothetical protein